MKRRIVSLLLVLCILISGCDFLGIGSVAKATGNFVGKLATAETFVGVTVSGANVLAYICDGKEIGEWFTGTIVGGTVELVSTTGGKMAATVGDATVTGTIALTNSEPVQFTLDVAQGTAGLYRSQGIAAGVNFLAGLIMLNNGEFRGNVDANETDYPISGPVNVVDGKIKLENIAGIPSIELTRANPDAATPTAGLRLKIEHRAHAAALIEQRWVLLQRL